MAMQSNYSHLYGKSALPVMGKKRKVKSKKKSSHLKTKKRGRKSSIK